MNCRLCYADVINFFSDKKSHYYQCPKCNIVLIDEKSLPSLHIEQAFYENHNNSADDNNYIEYINQCIHPVRPYIQSNSLKVLDYGCGPSSVLNKIDCFQNLMIDAFDPIYNPTGIKADCYELIICIEVVEHFHKVRENWQRLASLMSSSSVLLVKTQCLESINKNFELWPYRHDPTHVCFYSHETIKWLSDFFGLKLEIPSHDTFLFIK